MLTEPSLLGAVDPGDKIDQHGHDLQVPNLNNKPTLAIMVREHKATEQAPSPWPLFQMCPLLNKLALQ